MIILPSEKFPTFKDSNFINNILQLSIIIVIGIVIFYKLLSGFFVTDDFLLIYRAAEEEINAKSIFTPYLDMPFGKFFRPLSLLFFSGLFKIVSINPFYYHFTSILFHCFNSFLVLKISN